MNKYSSESPFPNSSQELLIKTALSEKQVALDCWEKWKSVTDFENDVDLGSFRLLPLIFYRLHSFGHSDEFTGRLKGIYRKSWSKNQQLLYEASSHIKDFNEADIEVIVVKGIPLSLNIYDNLAVRPMYDVDILVPFKKKMEAIHLLRKKGFTPADERILEYNLTYSKGMGFRNKSGYELDLHWRPLPDSILNADVNDFWDKVRPINILNSKALAMCPEDELLCTIVHGMRRNPLPPIRWVTDAVSIIRKCDGEIDWDRFSSYTTRYKVVIQVKKGLEYLIQNFDLQIPEQVVLKLKSIHPTYAEKVVYKQANMFVDHQKYFPPLERVFAFYARFLRYSAKENIIKLHYNFCKYAVSRVKSRLYGGA